MITNGAKYTKNEHMNLYHGIHKKSSADVPPSLCKQEPVHEECNSDHSSLSKLFDELLDEFFDGKIDNDKLLIGALMYMLIKEGADMKLIIALGYILM
ncbi:hypothetical protein [Ruminococcus sp.]|uniref:hypothetical protein n=1 Tax=Ruminococcus sp. TaxID=41978 RepID=UPI0025DB3032|nr:hypothetical protein [Ruminococcus sp.]